MPDNRTTPPTHIVVLGVSLAEPSDLVQDAEMGLLIPHKLEATSIDRMSKKSSITSLLSVIDKHVLTTTSHSQTEVEQKNSLRIWDALLEAQQSQLQNFRLNYVGFEIADNGATLLVHLSSPTEATRVELSQDSLLQMTNSDGQQVVAGYFEDLGGTILKIGLARNVDVGTLKDKGVLTLDNAQVGAVIKRQREAVKRLRYGETAHPRLAQLLIQPSNITIGNATEVDCWFQDSLDSTQRRAVRRSLAAEDMFAIQGPPGTGKTAIIAELVLQILNRDPQARILIASQSNVAVNHALSGIVKLQPTLEENIVRIGREEKAGRIEHLLMDRQLQAWREQVVQRSDQYLVDLQSRAQGSEELQTAYGYLSECQKLEVDLAGLFQELPVAQIRLAQIEEEYRKIEELLDQKTALRGQIEQLARGVHAQDSRLDNILQVFEREIIDWARQFLTDAREITQLSAQRIESIASVDRIQTRIKELQDDIELRRMETQDIIKRLLGRDVAELPDQQRLLDTHFAAQRDEVRRLGQLQSVIGEWKKLFGKDVTGFIPTYLARCRVVGATCMGIAASGYVGEMMFDWVIIDEAGRATHPEILVPMVRGRRIVLVGDHRQLPPIIGQDLITVIKDLDEEVDKRDLENTLFQEIVEQVKPGVKVQLDVQYRMHTAIARLISNCFYEGELKSAQTTEKKHHLLDWSSRPVIWQSTQTLPHPEERRVGSSFRNETEIEVVIRLLERMNESYGGMALAEPKTIGVIAGYSAQKAAIRQRVDARTWSSAIAIEVDTVDAYQGRERDVIIYSVVRSNNENKIGFLRDERRLNVALSRACELLIIVGDERVEFADVRGNNPFRAVLQHIRAYDTECCLEPAQL